MLKVFIALPPILLVSLLFAEAQSPAPARDWTTWGYDQERTGWNRGETAFTTDNVSGLRLLWKTQLGARSNGIVLSTLTAPLVVEGVRTGQGTKNLLFLLGADDTIFALDADTGKVFWQKTLPTRTILRGLPPGCARTR